MNGERERERAFTVGIPLPTEGTTRLGAMEKTVDVRKSPEDSCGPTLVIMKVEHQDIRGSTLTRFYFGE
jgi:hypothetical protein